MAPAVPRRFLLVGHNAGGTVPPMLALAQAMVGRGHDVTWLSQPPAGAWTETFASHDRLISVVPGSFDAPVTATQPPSGRRGT